MSLELTWKDVEGAAFELLSLPQALRGPSARAGGARKGALTVDILLLGGAALARSDDSGIGRPTQGRVGPLSAHISAEEAVAAAAHRPRSAERVVGLLFDLATAQGDAAAAAAVATELIGDVVSAGRPALLATVHAEFGRRRVVAADSGGPRLAQICADAKRAVAAASAAVEACPRTAGIALFLEAVALEPFEKGTLHAKLARLLRMRGAPLPAGQELLRVAPTAAAAGRALDVAAACAGGAASFADAVAHAGKIAAHELCHRNPACVAAALELVFVSLAAGCESPFTDAPLRSLDLIAGLLPPKRGPDETELRELALLTLEMHARAAESGALLEPGMLADAVHALTSLGLPHEALCRCCAELLRFLCAGCCAVDVKTKQIPLFMALSAAEFPREKLGGLLLRGSPESCTSVVCSLLQLAGLIAQRRMDVRGFPHFLNELAGTLKRIEEWGGGDDSAAANAVAIVLRSGVAQFVNGTNYYKALLFNNAPILQEVSSIPQGASMQDRVAILETVLRSGESMLSDEILSEAFMQSAVPLAIALSAGSDLRGMGELLGALLRVVDQAHIPVRLMQMRRAFQTLSEMFPGPDGVAAVRNLFLSLVAGRGKRDAMRMLLLSASFPGELQLPRYSPLLSAVLGTNRSVLLAEMHRERVLEVLALAVSVCAPRVSDATKRPAVTSGLTDSALSSIGSKLSEEKPSISRKDFDATLGRLRRIALFQSLFPEELAAEGALVEELEAKIDSRFPREIFENFHAMEELELLGTRVERTQSLYSTKKQLVANLVSTVQVYLAPDGTIEDPVKKLAQRRAAVEEYVASSFGNPGIRARLVECGYSERLWDTKLAPVSVTVEVDVLGARSEAGIREALAGIVGEYSDILQRLGVPSVVLSDGTAVNSNVIFEDAVYLTVDEIKTRRAAAVSAIEAKIASASDETHEDPEMTFFSSRTKALIAREEALDIRHVLPSASKKKPERKTFVVRLNRSFFGCAACCGAAIAGCYGPTGCHAEKPADVALKHNFAFASLHELNADGSLSPELENSEVLFSDQGAVFFRLYTTGHTFDTSVVWAAFLRALANSKLVPAVILPRDHPSIAAFNIVAAKVLPQAAAAQLTFLAADEGAGEACDESVYYDTAKGDRPSLVNVGDVVMDVNNAGEITDEDLGCDCELDGQDGAFGRRRTFLRSSSKLAAAAASSGKVSLRRDFAGTILTKALAALNGSERWGAHAAAVAVMARPASQFVELHVSKGVCNGAPLAEAIDLGRWNKQHRRGRLHRRHCGADAALLEEPDFRALAGDLEEHVHKEFNVALDESPTALLSRDPWMFFERLSFARMLCQRPPPASARCKSLPSIKSAAQMEAAMEAVLGRRLRLKAIGSLELQKRRELMRWIARTEEVEWRTRGGRHSTETAAQFIAMAEDAAPFPGIVAMLEDEGEEEAVAGTSAAATVPKRTIVVGYTVGEFIRPGSYEVVTAWVDRRARGMNIAAEMYRELAANLRRHGAREIVTDIAQGTLLRFGWLPIFHRFTVTEHCTSWSAQRDDGSKEQFERVVLSCGTSAAILRSMSTLRRLREWLAIVSLSHGVMPRTAIRAGTASVLAIAASIGAIIIAFRRHRRF